MSALPSEADMRGALGHVGLGSILLQNSAAADGLSVILFNGDRL
jgi:hypothetical protein